MWGTFEKAPPHPRKTFDHNDFAICNKTEPRAIGAGYRYKYINQSSQGNL